MKLRWLGVCLATAFALTAQTGRAQVRGLAEEAAERAAADAQLQTNISNEATARAGMDATLLMGLQKETNERKAADQALQDSIGAETGLKGQYSFTGTALCLSSSTGFRTDFELVPLVVVAPPPPATSTALTTSSNSISGVRTFNGDGTGSVVATVHNITYPAQVFGGVSFFTGGAAVSTLQADFTYEVKPDRTLVIDDGPTNGVITKGGNRVGWKTTTLGVPRFVGKISKDWKTISVTHEDMVVEQSVLTSPDGVTPFQQFVIDRVCHRERTLYKVQN